MTQKHMLCTGHAVPGEPITISDGIHCPRCGYELDIDGDCLWCIAEMPSFKRGMAEALAGECRPVSELREGI